MCVYVRVCVRACVPCVPEEPSGPRNSWGFVGEEEGLHTLSRYPRCRCVRVYVCMSVGQKERYLYACVFLCHVQTDNTKANKVNEEERGKRRNCREMRELKTIFSCGLSKTEPLFKLQPTCTSGMQCLLLPWKIEKVSAFLRGGSFCAGQPPLGTV